MGVVLRHQGEDGQVQPGPGPLHQGLDGQVGAHQPQQHGQQGQQPRLPGGPPAQHQGGQHDPQHPRVAQGGKASHYGVQPVLPQPLNGQQQASVQAL